MQRAWWVAVLATMVVFSGCVGQPAPQTVGDGSGSPEGAGNETAPENATSAPAITEETVIAEAPLALVGPVPTQDLAFELKVDAPILVVQAVITSAAALDFNIEGPGDCAGGGTTGQLTLVGPVMNQPLEKVCGPVPAGKYTATASATGGAVNGTFRVVARPASGAGNATLEA